MAAKARELRRRSVIGLGLRMTMGRAGVALKGAVRLVVVALSVGLLVLRVGWPGRTRAVPVCGKTR